MRPQQRGDYQQLSAYDAGGAPSGGELYELCGDAGRVGSYALDYRQNGIVPGFKDLLLQL